LTVELERTRGNVARKNAEREEKRVEMKKRRGVERLGLVGERLGTTILGR
jgi:hypothetical protein